MNYVDISAATIATDWRFLLQKFGVDPDGLASAIKAERGEPVSLDDYTPEQLLDAKQQTTEVVRTWLVRPFKLYFKYQCPNWRVTDDEIDKLADIYAQLFAKYYPDFYQHPYVERIQSFIEGYGLEAQAIVLTWRFFTARKGIPRKVPKAQAGNGSTSSTPSSDPISTPSSPLPDEV